PGHLGASMALFGKDRERSDRRRGFAPEAAPVPPRGPAPREGEMFERDKTQVDETGATSAFLGKGSRVSGKLGCEGAVRIEGQEPRERHVAFFPTDERPPAAVAFKVPSELAN